MPGVRLYAVHFACVPLDYAARKGITSRLADSMSGGKHKKITLKFNLRRLGVAIRERRQELGYSQEDLAAACKLHRTYISGIERGVRNPTITCIDDVARALEYSLTDLVQRTEVRK